jgi:deoxyribodipyrimidine photo-lyase
MSVIHWSRRDLRLSVNIALNAAIRECGGVVITRPSFRVSSPLLLGQRYDTISHYVHTYELLLADVLLRYLYAPWKMPAEVQRPSGCIIGGDYPMPIVDHDVQKEEIVRRFKGGQP